MWHYRLSQKACQSELLLYYIYKKQFFIPDCKIFPVPTVADNAVHTARNGVIVPSFALLLSYIFPMVFFIANDTNYGWDSSNKFINNCIHRFYHLRHCFSPIHRLFFEHRVCLRTLAKHTFALYLNILEIICKLLLYFTSSSPHSPFYKSMLWYIKCLRKLTKRTLRNHKLQYKPKARILWMITPPADLRY